MKRKLMAWLLVAVLLLTGCASGLPEQSEPVQSPLDTETQAQETTCVTIGIYEPIEQEDTFAYELMEFVPTIKEMYNIQLAIKNYANTGISYEEYRTIVATELMTGDGCDLYDLSVVDYVSLGKEGYLLDLSDWEVLNDEDLFLDVITTSNEGGENGIYGVPLSFAYEMIGTPYKDMAQKMIEQGNQFTWEEFIEEFGQDARERNVLLIGNDEHELFEFMFRDDFNEYIDMSNQTETLDSPEMIQLLQQCRQLADDGLIFHYGEAQENTRSWEIEWGTSLFHLQNFFIGGTAYLLLDNLDIEFKDPSLINFYPGTRMPSNLEQNQYYGDYRNIIGISKLRNNTENAKQVLEFLIGTQAQVITSGHSIFPINRSVFNTRTRINYSNLTSDATLLTEVDSTTFAEMMTEKMESIELVSRPNYTVRLLVGEIAEKYFSGQSTAEEAAQEMSNRVSLYLKEQG